MRITVASMRMATATANPACWKSRRRVNVGPANETAMTVAASVNSESGQGEAFTEHRDGGSKVSRLQCLQLLPGFFKPAGSCLDQRGQHGQPLPGAGVGSGADLLLGLLGEQSASVTGLGAAHGPQRSGSSKAHWAMSR